MHKKLKVLVNWFGVFLGLGSPAIDAFFGGKGLTGKTVADLKSMKSGDQIHIVRPRSFLRT